MVTAIILSICFSVLHLGKAQAVDPVIIKPANWAYDICFSPDGKYLAISGLQSLQIWDVERQKFAYDVNLPGLWGGYTVDFSHDGALLAVSGVGTDIFIYKFRSRYLKPQLLKNLNANLAVMSLDFSPNGRWLAARGQTSSTVFDLSNGKSITIQTPKVSNSWAMRILFSPNGKLLAVDGTPVKIWKVGSWEKPTLQPGSVDGGISFTPTSLTLAGGSCRYNGEVSQWRLKTGMTSRIILSKIRTTTYIEYSPGGNYLAVAGGQNLWQAGSIEIWKTNPKKVVKTLKGNTGGIFSLDFTSDGRFLASCSNDRTVRLWDISDIADPAPQSVDAVDELPTTWGNVRSGKL